MAVQTTICHPDVVGGLWVAVRLKYISRVLWILFRPTVSFYRVAISKVGFISLLMVSEKQKIKSQLFEWFSISRISKWAENRNRRLYGTSFMTKICFFGLRCEMV